MTGGPLNPRSYASKEDNLQDLQDDVTWLKHTPEMYARKSEVLERMKKTFPVRQDMVTKAENTAGSVIQEFPRFLNTPGLVSNAVYLCRLIYKTSNYTILVWRWQ